jgi:hypothetical protein
MANGLYTTFKNALMEKEVNLDSDTIAVALLDNTYIKDLATDDSYSILCSASEIDSGVLTSKVISSGRFDAGDHEFPNVTHGTPGVYIVIYNQSTDQLIAYFDTDSLGGAISTPATGEDFHTNWNVAGIFRL